MTTIETVIRMLDSMPDAKARELQSQLERYSPGTPLSKEVASAEQAMSLVIIGMREGVLVVE